MLERVNIPEIYLVPNYEIRRFKPVSGISDRYIVFLAIFMLGQELSEGTSGHMLS